MCFRGYRLRKPAPAVCYASSVDMSASFHGAFSARRLASMVETILLEIQRMRYAGNGERCCAHSSAAAAHRTRKQDKLPGLSAGQTYGRTTSSVAKRVPRWHVHTTRVKIRLHLSAAMLVVECNARCSRTAARSLMTQMLIVAPHTRGNAALTSRTTS